MTAISVENLSIAYGTVQAVDHVTFEVRRGEFFGILGTNGAGKTTTLEMIEGLRKPDGGSIQVLGRSPWPRDSELLPRIGVQLQASSFFERLTAREQIGTFASLYGVDRSAADSMLEAVGLDDKADARVEDLSGGQTQRLSIACALVHDPELVILDEPMSGLDPVGRAMVRDIILEERDAGRTVFFSSHILSDVSALCDRVGIVVGGELRGVGTLSQLIGDRVRYVECQIAGADEVSLPGTTRGVDAGVRTVRCAPDEVDALIDAARRAGGRILQVQPVRESLEDVLLTEVERAVPVDQARLGVLS